MRTLKRNRYITLLLTVLMIAFIAMPTTSIAAEEKVNLGSASTFAVLGGSTITNTGTTSISGSAGGDIGLYPGTSFTAQADVSLSGTIHLADAVASKAKDDLVTAYNDAAGRAPVTTIPSELGGTTLTPGVYDSADGTFQITGTLTLDGQGDPDCVFIFKTASTLKTAVNSNIELIGEARSCGIYWQVGSSATLEVGSHFEGYILAMDSITANTGTTVHGKLLARNGAVTLDSITITNDVCETTDTPVPAPVPAPVEDLDPGIPPVAIITETVTGGQIPNTSTNIYELLLIGAALTALGVVGLKSRKRNDQL